jgi:glycosyltransferase involved in cell wall biosynthesis
MKKIIYVHHGSVPGGAPTSLKNLVSGINKLENVDCTVACARDSMIPFFEELKGVCVTQYPETSLLAGRWFIWGGTNRKLFKNTVKEVLKSIEFIKSEIKYIKNSDAVIVHLNSSILWTTGIAAKLSGKKIVWHDRETFEGGIFNIRRIAYSWFMKLLANKIICIGPQEYKKIGGKRSKKVELIYNSLDDSYFTEATYDKDKLRENLDLPKDKYLYLSLGGNSFRKGTYQLIKSVNYLDNTYGCVIGGNPPKQSEEVISNEIIKSLELEDKDFVKGKVKALFTDYNKRVDLALREADHSKLLITGELDDVKAYLRACDVLVFAGTTPHSGRPIYEAWALKKPVIVFDSEVMRMDVEDGVDGIIVKKHTAEALAEAVDYLKKNPELAVQMGENGYKKSVERFSLKSNTQKVLSVYREVLGEDSI